MSKVTNIRAAPVHGHLDLRCGNCRGMEYSIHVQMHLTDVKIARCKCTKCGQIRTFDDQGTLQSTGKVDLYPRKHQ